MRNSDLVAFFKPIPNQFSGDSAIDFADFTGQVGDIDANAFRITIRVHLSAGLYCGILQTAPNAFDISTAMIEMVRAPDGARVPVGPWDLDHIHNVMAMPMVRTWVNGKLKGGLWFAMPGPQQIANGSLTADFGFEAEEGLNELVFEIIERDRGRLSWANLEFLELRRDDRRTLPLLPATSPHPRLFISAQEAPAVLARWSGTPEFDALLHQLRTADLAFLTDNSQGTLEVACLVYALTGDAEIGSRAKEKIMALAHAGTWSGRPDPLLMGGDNDRGIGQRLYHSALAWEFLQPLLSPDDRSAILAKAQEYLQKSYDFTLLQRAYMGYPTIEPHSLGTWNGTAIACMAFYDDLAIARHALPLYHGLFADSLTLFPASGKAAWATYFPFHLILYLAAANTFAGPRPELCSSPFLDNLGQALLACYRAPNSQELQRGLRTREHRFLTAFLCRFHPTQGIDAIYRAFAQAEQNATGEVVLGNFDLLYAPPLTGDIAPFPSRPLIAKDVGDIIATAQGEHTVAVSLNAGPKSGRKASFTLMPHNREFPPALAAFEVTIDGTPVLCNINMGQYGQNSALTNTMSFNGGGSLTNGQYLNGAIPPHSTSLLRRCFIDDRFLYAHIVITASLHPSLQVTQADRIFLFDRQSGAMLISDAFASRQPLSFATHLHCSGSVTQLAQDTYRLTGGQANKIAGIKGGSKGLSDEERGEIFVQILSTTQPSQVAVEEPTWVPGYIYGLNNTGLESISEGCFPRYQRWRLHTGEPVSHGAFLFALTPQPGQISRDGGSILFPANAAVQLGHRTWQSLGVSSRCECLLSDPSTRQITAIAARSLTHGALHLEFPTPVDLEYSIDTEHGVAFSQSTLPPHHADNVELSNWLPVQNESWKTLNSFRMTFRKSELNTERGQDQS